MRLALLLVVVLSGCSQAGIQTPIKPLRDYRGIIHCHSKYSHDSKGTYEEILAAAKAAKVDFICMTDHPPSGDKGLPLREGWRGMHDGVLFIQGAEYSDQILGLGLKEPISGLDRRGTIKAIHEQGGVAIACHPELIDDWDAYADADGMEIYNVHAAFTKKSKDPAFMAQVAKALKEDPEHSFRLLRELDPEILKVWDGINVVRRFTGIAGNDSHQNVGIPLLGLKLDPYVRAFRYVTTHVQAEELTESAILEGIRTGNAFVMFELSRSDSPLSEGTRLPGEGEAVTIIHAGSKAPFELPGAESIGSSSRWRAEWWLLESGGRIPWILWNWNNPGKIP